MFHNNVTVWKKVTNSSHRQWSATV